MASEGEKERERDSPSARLKSAGSSASRLKTPFANPVFVLRAKVGEHFKFKRSARLHLFYTTALRVWKPQPSGGGGGVYGVSPHPTNRFNSSLPVRRWLQPPEPQTLASSRLTNDVIVDIHPPFLPKYHILHCMRTVLWSIFVLVFAKS